MIRCIVKHKVLVCQTFFCRKAVAVGLVLSLLRFAFAFLITSCTQLYADVRVKSLPKRRLVVAQAQAGELRKVRVSAP